MLRKSFLSQMVNDMSKHELRMVEALGTQLSSTLGVLCNAVVESRRIDMEGLESSDKKEVLMSEGTTLQALVESNNKALCEMWESMAPMTAQFLGQMAEVQKLRAEASLKHAEADFLNAKSRAKEAKVKKANAKTEAKKAASFGKRARAAGGPGPSFTNGHADA